MKHISRTAIAILLAMLVMTLMPAQVFADSLPEYVSEVKVYIGNYNDAENEGYKILSGNDGKPVDLNQGAGGGMGSKGDKAVYLGYKTTTNSKEAITDLALMNMKGGYKTADYDVLMETQMNQQIIPFVESFLVTIDEYRVNYTSKIKANRERAQYMHDLLNKLIDDDTGKGLGDLLLNKTRFEMTESRYDALSQEEKNNHADILTIIAQSNVQATLVMSKLLTRAADTYEDSWLERFQKTTYEDLVEDVGGLPTDAAKQLARMFDDDAQQILEQWDDVRTDLLTYDEANSFIENNDEIDISDLQAKVDSIDKDSDAEAYVAALKALTEADKMMIKYNRYANIVAIHDYLESIAYQDGTLLDFFTQDTQEVTDDTTVLYPLIASLTDGQRAGLDFITLEELILFSEKDIANYRDEELEKMEAQSIYKGVDRAIYEKGGVALTSDALRKDALENAQTLNEYEAPVWLNVLKGLSAAATVGFIASVTAKIQINKGLWAITRELNKVNAVVAENKGIVFEAMQFKTRTGQILVGEEVTEYQSLLQKGVQEGPGVLAPKNAICNKLMVGLGVAMVILTAVTVYLSWKEMHDHYKVDFTPIPRYMVDEKDIIGYNRNGEKIVIKNQSAYYNAVESNLKKGDFKFDEIGALADINGCVGKQWLALYSNKNEFMDPILASSLIAVVGSTDIPAGYTAGIHMFGSDSAFNLNSNLYDWNNNATSVFVYFKTDEGVNTSTSGSNFTGGAVALTGGVGPALGAVVTALAMKPRRKKETKAEA